MLSIGSKASGGLVAARAPFPSVIRFYSSGAQSRKQPLVRIRAGGAGTSFRASALGTPRGCGPVGNPLIHGRGIIFGKRAWPQFLRAKRVIFDSWVERPLCCPQHVPRGQRRAPPRPQKSQNPSRPPQVNFLGVLHPLRCSEGDGGLGKAGPWCCSLLRRDVTS